MAETVDVAVVGSGFAGAILARLLARGGLAVALLERGRHPRFAIGESSTPLAAIGLERLARTYGEDHLSSLAAWGRWRERLPQLGCGRKRGFTFYRHHPGKPFAPGSDNEERLLVAASPVDAVADAHWLRSDVDAFLVERARAAGVHYVDEVELTDATLRPSGWHLGGARRGRPFALDAAFAVDATGPTGFLPRATGLPEGRPLRTRAGLIYSHFEAVDPFVSVAGPFSGDAPYPEEWAAVHHLVDEGWLYDLRFDSGLVSAGLLVDGGLPREVEAESAWRTILARYPSLGRQFERARPSRPLESVSVLQYRRGAAGGPGWAALPHAYAFVDPLFSTGIAWSLLGVERLAELLLERGPGSPSLADGTALLPYLKLLSSEADQIDRLVAAAYRARARFDLFVAQSLLYFALVSFAEARQRLLDPPLAAWEGFLGAGEPEWEELFEAAYERLGGLTTGGRTPADDEADGFARWLAGRIERRNVAGLADRSKRNLYAVDLDALVENADRLGLSREAVGAALPRLRGAAG